MRRRSAFVVILTACSPAPGPAPPPAASASAIPSASSFATAVSPPPAPAPAAPTATATATAAPEPPVVAPVSPSASVGPPTSLDVRPDSARACRHARADHMAKTCTRDEQCPSRAILTACPSVPMTFTCERGRCRSRRTDGCDPPYELDADAMRKTIVDCFVP